MWSITDIQFSLANLVTVAAAADRIFTAVWRLDFSAPGFCVLDLGPELDSHALRSLMLDLKERLSAIADQRCGTRFAYRSLGRLNQQVTTRFHLDGAPDQSLLMLGYEPSAVQSRLTMADYSRCAADLGIVPKQFLDEYNPMYRQGEARLAGYQTELPAVAEGQSRIVLINNSSLPFSMSHPNPLGVLHQAEIPHPNASHRRVINSIMLRVGDTEEIDADALQRFIATDAISGVFFDEKCVTVGSSS